MWQLNYQVLMDHLSELSYRYPIEMDDEGSHILVSSFDLPPGYNRVTIEVLMSLDNYPVKPPGVSPSRVYVPDDLLYHGSQPKDFHPGFGPAGWAWWCFEEIDWDPCRDDLIVFFELLRLTMTKPEI